MKILALRVAEVGLFRDGVAVEGFSGGLDVLAGPNELGKSTLFRAIRSVFLIRHTVTGRAVDEMASRGGTRSPVIEADFEAAGKRWRITKKFGKGKAADLVDLETGRATARGPDAEDALAALIGAVDGTQAGGQFGLLWVGQQQSLHVPTPDFDPDTRRFVAGGERATLQGAIAAEVDSVAGGALSRRVAERVAAELETYLQPKRRAPKKGSRYEIAGRQRQELIERREHLRSEQEKAAARLDRLETLLREQEAQAGPELLMSLRDGQVAAQRAVAEAEKLAGAVAHAKSREEVARFAHDQAAARLKDYAQGLESFETLTAERASLGEKKTSALADRARLAKALTGIESEIEATEVREQRLDEDAARVRRMEELRAAIASGEATLVWAGALLDEISGIELLLRDNPATPERMRRYSEAKRSADIADERAQEPAVVDVVFNLDAAGADRVRVNGGPVSRSGRVGVDDVVLIEIEGVGSFEVIPADAAEREKRRAQAEAARQRLLDIEAELGVSGEVAALALADARQELQQRIGELKPALAAQAPGGVAEISERLGADRQEMTRLEAQVSAQLVSEPPLAATDGMDLEPAEPGSDKPALRRSLVARLRQLRTKRDEARSAVAEMDFAVQRMDERLCEIAVRLNELDESLGPPAGRSAERDRLAGLVDESAAALKQAMQERALLVQSAPSADSVAQLRDKHLAAAALARNTEDLAARLAREIAALEGEIRAAGEAEIGPEIARLDGEIAALDTELAHHEHEVAALELLQATMQTVAAENRTRFLMPVINRLQPFLHQVFPDAEVVLNEAFGLEALSRGGDGEAIDLLSDGTREQLAVLVRLGFGRLLADAGTPAPLILDDALVYSDDARIAHMFGALRMAAERYQVIVFTCRSATFAPLGGTPLAIKCWDRT
ncbi:MAG: hypothetical protein ACWGMY_06670 [Hyphomicrobiaceae bacterium]